MSELKLTTISPRIRHAPTNAAGTVCSSSSKLIGSQQGLGVEDCGGNFYLVPCTLLLLPDFSLNDFAHLEDWQIHRNHHAADQRAEDHHDDRLHQAGDGCHRIIHFGFIEVGHFAE